MLVFVSRATASHKASIAEASVGSSGTTIQYPKRQNAARWKPDTFSQLLTVGSAFGSGEATSLYVSVPRKFKP